MYNINTQMNTDEKKSRRKNGGPTPGTPSPLRGRPSPLRGRTFPNKWASGPDPEHHRWWRRWLLAQCQARFWAQDWTLTWPEYLSVAETIPRDRQGRGADSLCITRRDLEKGWHADNIAVITRRQMAQRRKITGCQRRDRRLLLVAKRKQQQEEK